jgi:4-amino-4-deoxy-L-arabinose transferase-like glycosyltransferase
LDSVTSAPAIDSVSAPVTLAPRAFDRFWLLLWLLPPLLIFPRIGDSCLWQDEAETALLGRCVLLHGYPLAFDGHSVITDQLGKDLNQDGVWIWSPWLPLYLTAASFGVLGESTTAARLPFALTGWLVLLVFYACAREMTGDRTLARLATIFLLASVPFLLHTRQCRYYTLLSLFSVLLVWGSFRIQAGARQGRSLLTIGAVGLYHTFFPQLALSAAAIGIFLALSRSRWRVMRSHLLCAPIILVLTVPFFLYEHAWSRNYDNSGHGFDSVGRYLAELRGYGLLIQKYAFPFLVLLPLAAFARRACGSPAFLILTSVIALLLALTSPPTALSFTLLGTSAGVLTIVLVRQALAVRADRPWLPLVTILVLTTVLGIAGLAPMPFFRYLLGMLPFLALLTAGAILSICAQRRFGRTLTVLASAVLIGTDLVQFGPLILGVHVTAEWLGQRQTLFAHVPSEQVSESVLTDLVSGQRLQSPPLLYLSELTHEYIGPVKAVLQFLEKQAQPGDTLITTYEHFPLMFYSKLRVIQNDDPDAASLVPRWLFMHGNRAERLSETLSRVVDTGNYKRAVVHAIEFPWDNVPEPQWHLYETLSEGAPVRLFYFPEAR